MYPELMVKPTRRVLPPIPMFYMHYVPMNHSFGRSGVFSMLEIRNTVLGRRLLNCNLGSAPDVPELGYFGTDKPYPRGELLIKTHSNRGRIP